MKNIPNVRERAIAGGIALSMCGSIGFMVAYAEQGSTQWEGLALAAVFTGFMIAALGWARWILPQEQVTDIRDTFPQPVEERAAQVEAYAHGVAELTRKTWLTRMVAGAFGLFGLAALFVVGSLGPEPGNTLFHTRWQKGKRLQRADGSFVKVGDINVNAVETVFPDGSIGDYRSMAVAIGLDPGTAKGEVAGLVVFSKACTHAGCPVALYRSADKRLICPCHQSVFDVLNGASVVSGPADHPLPQLPITVASDGYIEAAGDFPAPIGPGFWEES